MNARIRLPLLLLLGALAGCGARTASLPPLAGDIMEVAASASSLAPEEQNALAAAGIRHLAIPLGPADAPAPLQLPPRLRSGVVLKLLVPAAKRPLLADEAFRRRLFTRVKEWAVQATVAETQVSAVLFHFEGPAAPTELEGIPELAKALRPLKVACGAGVPAFWVSDALAGVFEGFDFLVVFGQGCSWPPSGDASLVDAYRGQSRENQPAEPGVPHYNAVSFGNAAWVTRAGGVTEVHPAVAMGELEEGRGTAPPVPILGNTLVDPQYAFAVERPLTLGELALERGDKITVALANYPFRRAAFGAWSRRPGRGYLGRYFLPYAPVGGAGAIGFGTLADYLGGLIDGPVPVVEIQPSGGGQVLVMTNTTGLYTDLSATGNYLEWVLPQGRVRDASVGEFARFRFLAGEEEEVPVRATSIRFYEGYVAPYETIRTGPIFLTGPPTGTLVVHLTLPGGETLDYRFPTR